MNYKEYRSNSNRKNKKATIDLANVVYDEEFVSLLRSSNNDLIDEIFEISYLTTISYPTGDYDNPFIKDDFSFNYKLRITAVVKEFSFLNTPKIYYSYNHLNYFIPHTALYFQVYVVPDKLRPHFESSCLTALPES